MPNFPTQRPCSAQFLQKKLEHKLPPKNIPQNTPPFKNFLPHPVSIGYVHPTQNVKLGEY